MHTIALHRKIRPSSGLWPANEPKCASPAISAPPPHVACPSALFQNVNLTLRSSTYFAISHNYRNFRSMKIRIGTIRLPIVCASCNLIVSLPQSVSRRHCGEHIMSSRRISIDYGSGRTCVDSFCDINRTLIFNML